MCPGLGIALRTFRFFLLWPDIIQFGRATSDVVRGMSVTQFIKKSTSRFIEVTSLVNNYQNIEIPVD